MRFSNDLHPPTNQLCTLQSTDVQLVHRDHALQDARQALMLINRPVSLWDLSRTQPVFMECCGGQVLISQTLGYVQTCGGSFQLQTPP